MKNVLIKIGNEGFMLVDKSGADVFSSDAWQEVTEHAEENDLNIQYQPKDLVFDVDPDCPDGAYILFDIKHGGGGHDNLGSHNVINLPDYISPYELMECHFSYDESMSKEQVVEGLVAMGATHKNFL